MKVTVVGGTGLVGKNLEARLLGAGHEVTIAARSTGVDVVANVGLDEALRGADVSVDVTNSPSFADEPVMQFFRAEAANVTAAAKRAGVKHHVVLSVVGADRIPGSGYMRAKVAQEAIVREAGVPYTILRATQFFEFLGAIADGSTRDGEVRLPPAGFRPIAASDVAAALASALVEPPKDETHDLAGPERGLLSEVVAAYLDARGDRRRVVSDPTAGYFGAALEDGSLVPAGPARTGPTTLAEWLRAAKA